MSFSDDVRTVLTDCTRLARLVVLGMYSRSGLSLDLSPEAASVRAAQMRSVLRYTPWMMLANVVNAACVYVALGESGGVGLSFWAGAVLLLAFLGTKGWWRIRRSPPRTSASRRGIVSATWQASVLGLIWGILPAVWLPGSDAGGQLLIATLITGMICCGGFALATIPTAGAAFVTTLVAGSLIGLFRSDIPHMIEISVLLVAYALAVGYAIVQTGRLFIGHFESEAVLKNNGEVIQLLLNEFEENGSDWLFEVDAQKRIVSCSPRFQQVVREPSLGLQGTHFDDLLAPGGRRALHEALSGGRAFRDLLVEAAGDGGPRWWSVTAGPLHDKTGTISGWRGVGSDVTEAKLAKDRVVRMATTDPLTGLPNRMHFRECAERTIARGRAEGRLVGLASLDLDGFKHVNDTLGHAAGDELLTRISARLHTFAADDVTIGRLGGDEFGVIIDCTSSEASMVAMLKRMVDAISAPMDLDEGTVSVGGTAGLALMKAECGDIDRLMSNADTALYVAKEQQRGTVEIFTEAMQEAADEKRGLAEDLKQAIDAGELELRYQPIVESNGLRVVTAEALLRWHHPRRGLLAPDAFIGIAEASGQIGRIGAWVLAQACRDAATWPSNVGVAVNVSPAQLVTTGTNEAVRKALSASGLDPRRLELEITEAVFLRHGTQADDFMRAMRTLGVRIALDDFGTGYSSLGYITRFPIAKLKIDKSFVSGGSAIKERNAIISAIVGIARSLDMATTAEGVETSAELAWIRSLGCTQMQGYHFARPLTANAFAAYLAEHGQGEAATAGDNRSAA